MLLGTEFYNPPPFKIIKDTSFDHYSKIVFRDYKELQDFSNGKTQVRFERIKSIAERYPDDSNFILIYSNCLAMSNRMDEAINLLESNLHQKPDNLDLNLALAKLYYITNQTEAGSAIIRKYAASTEDINFDSITESQFSDFSIVMMHYFLSQNNPESFLTVYSWSLQEKYQEINKLIAGLFMPMFVGLINQKAQEANPDAFETKSSWNPDDTYFQLLELNNGPFHLPFAEFNDKYIDEISLQEIRAIEAIKNKEELAHDIKWLIKNDLNSLKNMEGVEAPTSAKTAMLIACSHPLSQDLPVVLSLLRIPVLPFLDILFSDYLFHYFLNPLYHLGLNNLDGLFSFLNDDSNHDVGRSVVYRALLVIAKENKNYKSEITEKLKTVDFAHPDLLDLKLPLKYEIVENKLAILIDHFNNIPYTYFEEDESITSFEESKSKKPISDMVKTESGGFVSKPDSLQSALFSNAFLSNRPMINPEPEPFNYQDDSIAPLKPVISKSKVGRNDPCPCGSGKKYKKCCWAMN